MVDADKTTELWGLPHSSVFYLPLPLFLSSTNYLQSESPDSLGTDTATKMHFVVCQVSEDWEGFVIVTECQQDSNALTCSSFAGTKKHGYRQCDQ